MKILTNRELLVAFEEQFNTGRLFTESQALVLMGYARGEGRKENAITRHGRGKKEFLCQYSDTECIHLDLSGMDKHIECKDCDMNPCFHCGHMNEEICNTCTIINQR